MSAYTPGPWEVEKPTVALPFYRVSNETLIICDTSTDSDEDGCNALLIAASPDLLEVVATIAEYFQGYADAEHDRDVLTTMYDAMREPVLAALAKANGGAA